MKHAYLKVITLIKILKITLFLKKMDIFNRKGDEKINFRGFCNPLLSFQRRGIQLVSLKSEYPRELMRF